MGLSIITSSFEAAELEPDSFPDAWVIEGSPQIRSRRIALSADGGSRIVAWSCTPGRFHWNYGVDETLYVLKGKVDVLDEDGSSIFLKPGVTAFFPRGRRTIWDVHETIEKIAVCRDTMPRPFAKAVRVWNRIINRISGIYRITGQGSGQSVAAQPALSLNCSSQSGLS